jgi:N-methylhydantoinase A
VTTGPSWRLGVDIGGTFTDGVLWNVATGQRASAKVLSTPDDLSAGLLAVVLRLLADADVAAPDVAYLAHGTTVATNAVLEGRLTPTAYVTTAGFRDVFEIARQVRPDPHDVFTQKPRPLVPRHLCFEVRERTSAQGEVLQALDEASVLEVAASVRATGVRAVAVCLLHAYVRPDHERQVAEMLREALPGVEVSASSDLVTEFREYPRACTVAINAGLVPTVATYLAGIEERLAEVGIAGDLHVMQSSGGVLSFDEARSKPVQILESGPAAGVMGAIHVGGLSGEHDLVSFDMGGTTAKVGLVREGRANMIAELEVGEQNRSRTWFSGASGYPVLVPSVDLVEIGAGGGSLAWIDSGGKLRVGPRSAGAVPGPAAFGRGGHEPTVTDANLVLGRLSPEGLLSGDLRLDLGAAEAAVASVGGRIGLGLAETALGIVAIADAAMVGAMRTVSIQRGYDPRDFTLVAFGGAGPLHALSLAEEMGIPRILIQPGPGIASALGLLVTDIRHDFSVTDVRPLGGIDPAALESTFAALERRGRLALDREGVPDDRRSMQRSIDVRYLGQSYQLVVPIVAPDVDAAVLGDAASDFHRLHERVYGYAEPAEPLELVNVRVSALGAVDKPEAMREWPSTRGAQAEVRRTRPVCFDVSGYVETAVLWRPSLTTGAEIHGPAVIEEHDSTTVVRPGWSATVSPTLDLSITRTGATEPGEREPVAALLSR